MASKRNSDIMVIFLLESLEMEVKKPTDMEIFVTQLAKLIMIFEWYIFRIPEILVEIQLLRHLKFIKNSRQVL